jgi:hypothetical protein
MMVPLLWKIVPDKCAQGIPQKSGAVVNCRSNVP